jgi:hypothetical protein
MKEGSKSVKKIIADINKVVAQEIKVELQSLIGKINFIRRFIANLSGKIQLFSPLLKLKADQNLYGEKHSKRRWMKSSGT